nr:hypothetical protein [uncultured Mucilaginibacter sp.]
MIIRILIVVILLLSILNIVGQPGAATHVSANKASESTKNAQVSPISLFPFVEILSALTILLLSRRVLNRQLKKIKSAALKPGFSGSTLAGQATNSLPPLYSSLQQG